MDERTNKLLETYKTQGPLTSGQIGDIFATTPITSESLAGETKPYTLPETTPSTTAAGLSGKSESIVATSAASAKQAQLEAETQAKATVARTEKQSTLDKLMETIGARKKVLETRPEVEGELKVGEKLQTYTDYTNQLDALSRAEQNELRALDTANITSAGKSAAQRDIQRKYAFEKADVAILQTAANRDYLTAKQLADDKINAQLEPLDEDLKYLEAFINFNKADWSEAEQRVFDLAKSDMEAERKTEEARLKQLSDAKLTLLQSAAEQNAPSSVLRAIQGAQTAEEAIVAAGQYGGDIVGRQIKQLQLQKAQEELSDSGSKLGNEADILQNAINQDASPNEAARAVALVYENQGIQVTKKQLDDWTVVASKMGKVVSETPETPVSKLEQEITELKKSRILSDSDVRELLRKRGYTQSEINTSSVGSVFDAATSFFSNLFGG